MESPELQAKFMHAAGSELILGSEGSNGPCSLSGSREETITSHCRKQVGYFKRKSMALAWPL